MKFTIISYVVPKVLLYHKASPSTAVLYDDTMMISS